MRIKKIFFIILLCGVIFFSGYLTLNASIYYMGQNPPGDEPERFAPGKFFNTYSEDINRELHSSLHFSKDGIYVYYVIQTRDKDGKYHKKIMEMKFSRGKWSEPQTLDFFNGKDEGAISLSHDRDVLYFSTEEKDEVSNVRIKTTWFMKFKEKIWSKPKRFNSPINNKLGGILPSFSKNGNMYFSLRMDKANGSGEILFSKYINGKYSEAVKLQKEINSPGYEVGAVIAPDESFIIFYSMGHHSEGPGQYVSFRKDDGAWSKAINMGGKINSGGIAFAVSFSPDGKYLFYLLRQNKMMKIKGEKRDEGIYWIKARIITGLRNKALNRKNQK